MRRFWVLEVALVAVLAGTAAYLLFGRGDKKDVASDLLADARRVMGAGTFISIVDDCPTCPPPIIWEFAPPDRIMLRNAKGHDDWPFALFSDGKAFFSQEGRRWREGVSAQAYAMLLADPRFLLDVTHTPRLGGVEELENGETTVVVTEFDFDLFLGRLPPSLEPEDEEDFAEMREVFQGAVIRFWVDNANRRVRQLDWRFLDVTLEGASYAFEFTSSVGIPDEIVSMAAAEALRLGQETEPAGRRLLLAIGAYFERHGVYPPELDAATLSDVLSPDEWPRNVFTGEPMRNADDSPGDFRYMTKADGAHCEITLHGWDGAQMYYDSQRFGPISLEPGAR
jgi:hypothetical protein